LYDTERLVLWADADAILRCSDRDVVIVGAEPAAPHLDGIGRAGLRMGHWREEGGLVDSFPDSPVRGLAQLARPEDGYFLIFWPLCRIKCGFGFLHSHYCEEGKAAAAHPYIFDGFFR
jgi:hypothetical protein